MFALLALYFLEVRGERGAIVKTITTTSMLYRLGELYHVPVFETPVGFKYVAPVMLSKMPSSAGRKAGGYGFRGHVPERDGMLAGCTSWISWRNRQNAFAAYRIPLPEGRAALL